jgi:hypothetical protein
MGGVLWIGNVQNVAQENFTNVFVGKNRHALLKAALCDLVKAPLAVVFISQGRKQRVCAVLDRLYGFFKNTKYKLRFRRR